MNKVRLISILIIILLLSFSGVSTVYAASNGADAHSPSMSVGAGPESSDDVNIDPPDSIEGTNTNTSSDNDDSSIDAEETVEPDAEIDDKAVPSDGQESKFSIWIIATIAVALSALGAAILLFRSRRKDKQDDRYRSRH